jgi:hypothetical protein
VRIRVRIKVRVTVKKSEGKGQDKRVININSELRRQFRDERMLFKKVMTKILKMSNRG